jgi:ATP-dependent Lon protease
MSDQDAIDYLRDQLATHRATLYTLERQRGTFGAAYVPAHIVLQIKQTRADLAQVKQALREAGEPVEDQLIDTERGKAQSAPAKAAPAQVAPAQSTPQSATTMTGPVTINQFQGPINGAILNISSQLDNVTQSISSIPNIDAAQKDELQSLAEEMKQQLQALSVQGHQADAEQISKRLNNTVAELQEEQPNQSYLETQTNAIKNTAAKHEGIQSSANKFLAKVAELL